METPTTSTGSIDEHHRINADAMERNIVAVPSPIFIEVKVARGVAYLRPELIRAIIATSDGVRIMYSHGEEWIDAHERAPGIIAKMQEMT